MLQKLIVSLLFFGSLLASDLSQDFALDRNLKVLHLTFHRGCAIEFSRVTEVLGLTVNTWYIHDLEPGFFEGRVSGSAVYNMGHDRAQRIWDLHKETFLEYDLIITSDTVPLSRIFLQNGFSKPLIIWMCNRFDYYDGASLDCDFPDREYFQLLKNAKNLSNVRIVAYNAFEHYYAGRKGIDTGNSTITPCAVGLDPSYIEENFKSSIPLTVEKEECFFLPPYHNETNYMNFQLFCEDLGIPSYCGRYNGSYDLLGFKGIICMPYAWSNLALFENIALGIPYFIPSREFLNELMQKPNYFFVNYTEKALHLSEWYDPKHKDVFIYFDSWKDLQEKIQNTDFEKQSAIIFDYSKQLQSEVMNKWYSLFVDLIHP